MSYPLYTLAVVDQMVAAAAVKTGGDPDTTDPLRRRRMVSRLFVQKPDGSRAWVPRAVARQGVTDGTLSIIYDVLGLEADRPPAVVALARTAGPDAGINGVPVSLIISTLGL